MKESTRAQRNAVHSDPQVLDDIEESSGMWYETPREVEAGLAWGKRKAALLKWVRRHMARRLTERERRCLELRYLKELSYPQIADREQCSLSSAHRSVARALRKLRCATEEDPSWRSLARPRKPRNVKPGASRRPR